MGIEDSARRDQPLLSLLEGLGLIVAADEKPSVCGGVQQRESHGDAFRTQLGNLVQDDKPGTFFERARARKKRGGMAVSAHAQQNDIEARYSLRIGGYAPANNRFVIVCRVGSLGFHAIRGDTR